MFSNLEVAYQTDKGQYKELNEDCYYINKNKGLFIISDGMGGKPQGDLASKLAVQYSLNFIKKNIFKETNALRLILKAAKKANFEIYNKSKNNIKLRGMGATLLIAMFTKVVLYIAYVGDSRLYLIRNDYIKQLTKDHTLVQILLTKKEITKSEAQNYRFSSFLTKAIGQTPSITPSQRKFQYKRNDYFLICTDGLTSMIDDATILSIINQRISLQNKCHQLIKAANQKGGLDNISIILIKVN